MNTTTQPSQSLQNDSFIESSIIQNHYVELEELKQQIVRTMRRSKLGLHKGECRVSKSIIEHQQKGQKLWTIGNQQVWAGTLKAARKKAHKLQLQQPDENADPSKKDVQN